MADVFTLSPPRLAFRQVVTQGFYAGRLDSVQQDVVLEADTVRQSIVVTASGLPMPQAQTSASVDVLHSSDLENRFTLIDPLRQIPGLNIVNYGQYGGATSIFVRGGNSDATRSSSTECPERISAASSI